MARCNTRAKGVRDLYTEASRRTVIRVVLRTAHRTSERGRTPQRHPIAFDPEHPNVVV